jgi:hypothetical protein
VETLFNEMGAPIRSIKLCVDNQGAIFWAQNPAQEHRSKHIDIRYHYVRELVESKKVVLEYIPTNEQNADLMTKNLSFDKVKFFRERLGLSLNEYPINSLIRRPDKLSRQEALDLNKLLLDFNNLEFEELNKLTHEGMLKLLDELLEEFKSDIDPFYDEDIIDK